MATGEDGGDGSNAGQPSAEMQGEWAQEWAQRERALAGGTAGLRWVEWAPDWLGIRAGDGQRGASKSSMEGRIAQTENHHINTIILN